MPSYDKTALWQQALAAKIDDPYAKERERLRVAYENVRVRAQPVAEAIARDLPDYTVHDVTHLDALWEYADLIAGPNYPLNPCEAFVVGCAFLFHDLGMGLAAYPEGLPGLKKLAVWKDIVAGLLRKHGAEQITEEKISQASAEIQKQAISETLRRLHAERADKLGLTYWESPQDNQRFHLIEDTELRDSFGPSIGKISYSHWWPIEQVAKEFPTIMGAQVGFPQTWTVDLLKLACILRCADFAHIDERRAPAFLRALRQPEGASDDHWKFQAKLYQPRLEGDRLIYTAKSGFSVADAGAWWLCYDTLNGIDKELRSVDSLLADSRRERFAARGVSQAEEPSRISKLIKTDGWQPVDTRVKVSAVADLVSKLGGKDLYGDAVTPPLREIIQNSADAVRARRLMDARPAEWGEIRITTGNDSSGTWIQVEDTGIGMSEAVLTGPLLDFGSSFWGSSLMHDQFPGLGAKGFQATGRYGIGFFSVFMWGERIEITTQRFDKGREDTCILSFRKGLKERPLLRRAQPNEYIPDGGTRVKVWLANNNILENLKSTFNDDEILTLAQVCARIAPCLDVNLKAEGANGKLEIAITANDWLTISDEALLKRIDPVTPFKRGKRRASYFETSPPPSLEILRSDDGIPMGRAAVWRWEGFYSANSQGAVIVGGLNACSLTGIIGVLVGSPKRASRDVALPAIPISLLTTWAKQELDRRIHEKHPPEILAELAEIFCALGVVPEGLPLAKTNSGWVSLADIRALAIQKGELLIVHDAAVELAGGDVAKVELKAGVLSISLGNMMILGLHNHDHDLFEWPVIEDSEKWGKHKFYSSNIMGAIIRSLSIAWDCSLKEILEFNSLESDEQKEVGALAGKIFSHEVYILRRPKLKSQR